MDSGFRVPSRWVVVLSFLGAAGCAATVVPFHPNVPEGGRAISVSVRPDDDNRVLVASETGGLFRTSDGGATWRHLDSLPSSRVWDIAHSPADPDVVIAATGDDYREAAQGGVWRSTDGGASWSHVGAALATSDRCPWRRSAYAVSFEPGSRRVYVAHDCGIAVSSDDGLSWSHVRVNPAALPRPDRLQHRVWSVLAGPGGLVYAAGAHGVAHSQDGGATWTLRTGLPPHGQAEVNHALATSPYDPRHVFLVAYQMPRVNVLFGSVDGGATWARLEDGVQNRPAFVRTSKVPGTPDEFYVYFGNGQQLRRRQYRHGTTPVVVADWQVLGLDHADPADLAIGGDGSTPVLLAGDGGVHRTTDAGATWALTGGGAGGFNALQLTEVTGQIVDGSARHSDLYYGTQDNSLLASSDGGATWSGRVCCEGFFIETARRTIDHGGATVSGVRCAACSNFRTAEHFTSQQAWNNPPDGDSNPDDVDGNPFSLWQPGHYIQRVVDDDAAPPAHSLMLSQDSGATWTARGGVPATLRGRPRLAGAGPGAADYNAVERAGVNADGSPRLGLVRIDNLYGPGDVRVTDADTGLVSLGTFPTMFAWYRSFAVDPEFPNTLWAADIGSGDMKVSHDRGTTWAVDDELTSLVTSDGAYRFSMESGFSLVSAIARDPDTPCHLLVGTRQNGVIRSTDGGQSWKRLQRSGRIPNVSSFFFASPRRVLVSSYGRGLWRLNLSPAPATCSPITLPPAPGPAGLEILDGVHGRIPFQGPSDPAVCPTCSVVLVSWGELSDVRMDGGDVREIAVSGGFLRRVDSLGRPLDLPWPVVLEPVARVTRAREEPAALAQVRKLRLPLRGLVVDGTHLRAAIVGHAQDVAAGVDAPRLRIEGNGSIAGDPNVEPGGRVVAIGTGFEPEGTAVTLRLDGELVGEKVPVDARGSFRAEILVARSPGAHILEAVQADTRALRATRGALAVVTRDKPDGRK